MRWLLNKLYDAGGNGGAPPADPPPTPPAGDPPVTPPAGDPPKPDKAPDKSSELTEVITKLDNHLSALRRKDELSEEALAQIDKHMTRLGELLPKDEPTVDPTLADEVKTLKADLAASKHETAVGKIVSEFNLSQDELDMINTADIETLSKRASSLRDMVEANKRRAAVALPDDLKDSETAQRLMRN